MNRKRRLTIVSLIFVTALISVSLVQNVSAAASITPSTQSGLINMPASFTAGGLDTSDQYTVEIGGVEVLAGLVCNSQNQLLFQVTPTIAGTHSVAVVNNASVTVCSATLVATDLFAVVVPVMVLFIGLSILFGIAKEMGQL